MQIGIAQTVLSDFVVEEAHNQAEGTKTNERYRKITITL